MAIVLRDVCDEEIAQACEIEGRAYQGDPLSDILAPGPSPPNALQQRIQKIVEIRQQDPSAHYMQAYDEAAGKMVAFAKWHIFETPESIAASARPLSFGEGKNVEACMLFFGGMADRKQDIMGDKPHLYLQLLHTDPEFQARGAGSLLMEWGKKKADGLGLPIYLESSLVGHRFYQKHGFEDVEMFQVDFTPFGGSVHHQPLMFRPATRS